MRISEVNAVVDEILDNFDFTKIHAYMTLTNWTWRNDGVPTIEAMREAAREYLLKVCAAPEPETSYGSGGFVAYKSDDVVHLSFELEWYEVAREMEVL